LAAVVALADVGIAISPAMARTPVRTIAVVLFVSDVIFEFRTLDMAFPINGAFITSRVNFRPATRRTLVPTGCE
jgi:hypothetical protein